MIPDSKSIVTRRDKCRYKDYKDCVKVWLIFRKEFTGLTLCPVPTYNVGSRGGPVSGLSTPALFPGGGVKIIRTVPAILTDNPEALATMVRQTEAFTGYAQFDIMDGQFVPSKSVTGEHIARLTMKLKWEAHLMVLRPEAYLEGFQRAGALKVVFHYEATPAPQEVITLVRSRGMKVGLAVNPETPLDAILPLADKVDSVLFLSVHPGFYGSRFLPEVLDKIAEFRTARPGIELGIDGGIKESNIAQVARSGVDVIYVGSAIYLQPRPAASFRRLQALAEANAPG